MKSFVSIAALVGLVTSSSVFAATLKIPMAFEYLALNGKEIATNSFSHQSELNLTPGTHKVAIRYHDMVEDDFSDSQSFVKSAPFILTLTVKGEQQYQLRPAGGKAIVKPKEYAKAPKIEVISSTDKSVAFSLEQTDIEEESFVSRLFTGNRGVDVEAAVAAATGGAQVKPTTTAEPQPAPAVAPQGDSPIHAQQMLQYWWLQADDATRKEFMSWAIKQL
ncbi:DUF2057 domain-containing protein [Shewanella sedimentimangrovi]|uniref:DUF2057 domain-containing protein n=1 Tax=Shewanella sedimentimangrovi TaxID=2814293 RepID=A0ABX7R3T8_9GAMM|nr:DUF2057 domain-containing protein [Shewanella sedimentimangrovi]QSX38491.1 DUF2057 domain-containing protein [Shewanella sedimentimangrovi]